jgi:hypothetical protein
MPRIESENLCHLCAYWHPYGPKPDKDLRDYGECGNAEVFQALLAGEPVRTAEDFGCVWFEEAKKKWCQSDGEYQTEG